VSVGTGFLGVYFGRLGEARHTQQLIDNSVAALTENVEERMKRIDEQIKSLSTTFEDAQYWEALTGNLTYDQKMALIKQAQQQAQQQAQRMGRKLGLPKSMQDGKASR
jgi:hypothetical protein